MTGQKKIMDTEEEQASIYMSAFHPDVKGIIFGEIFWYNSWERAIHDFKQGCMLKFGSFFDIDLLEIRLSHSQWVSFEKEIACYLTGCVDLKNRENIYVDKCVMFMGVKVVMVQND